MIARLASEQQRGTKLRPLLPPTRPFPSQALTQKYVDPPVDCYHTTTVCCAATEAVTVSL